MILDIKFKNFTTYLNLAFLVILGSNMVLHYWAWYESCLAVDVIVITTAEWKQLWKPPPSISIDALSLYIDRLNLFRLNI